ncbi:hypothetical protein AB0I53_09210 [Saccharopolyspora sp. NPDC050389]
MRDEDPGFAVLCLFLKDGAGIITAASLAAVLPAFAGWTFQA